MVYAYMHWIFLDTFALAATCIWAWERGRKFRNRKNSTFTTWKISLYAGIIGTLLSIEFGFLAYLLQNSIMTYQERARLITSVTEELKNTESSLTGSLATPLPITVNGKTYNATITYLQPLALEDAIHSGLFDGEDLQTMFFIARKMRFYNLEVSLLFSALESNSTDSTQIVLLAAQSLEKTKKALLKDVEVNVSKLEKL